uniref:Immunoglobulin V-set domain-containing protein n=1 Tax=Canis lupus familiaris TaxID=9615 RepID=A0A8C0LWM5_CANLF
SDIQGEKCYGSCPTFLISGHPVTPIASILALWIPQALGLPYASRRFQSILKRTRTFSCLSRASQATFRTSTGTWGRRPMVARMLFTYFPDLQWPQRDGSAMGQHDIVGFPNGSMMLHRVQPTDSGTYQVAVNINPAWIMRAKTEVQVAEKHKELPIIHLPVSAGIMAAIIIGSLSAGSLFICCIAHLLLTGGWRGQSHRVPSTGLGKTGICTSVTGSCGTCQPVPPLSPASGDQHIYEVMPSPTHLVSPLGGTSGHPGRGEADLESRSGLTPKAKGWRVWECQGPPHQCSSLAAPAPAAAGAREPPLPGVELGRGVGGRAAPDNGREGGRRGHPHLTATCSQVSSSPEHSPAPPFLGLHFPPS